MKVIHTQDCVSTISNPHFVCHTRGHIRGNCQHLFVNDPLKKKTKGELAPRLNVWKLNGLEHKHTLKYALSPPGNKLSLFYVATHAWPTLLPLRNCLNGSAKPQP